MSKFRVILPLLIFSGAHAQFTDPIAYTDSVQFLSHPGPRNADTSKYATIYFFRPATELDTNSWYGLNHEDVWLARVTNNSRFIERIPVEGKFSLWAMGNDTTSLVIDLKYGGKYFVRLDLSKGAPKTNLKLLSLDESQGQKEFDAITGKEYDFDYPLPINLETVFPKRTYSAYFIRNIAQPLDFATNDGPISFLPPVSTRFFYILPQGYQFVYTNKLLTKTFSEIDRVSVSQAKKMDSQEDLLDLIKKNTRNGKDLVSGKDKLKLLEYEVLQGGDLAYGMYDEVEDYNTPLRGDSPYLLLREYTIYMYKNGTGKKGIVSIITFSERGLPGEVHLKEELRYKAKYVMNSMRYP